MRWSLKFSNKTNIQITLRCPYTSHISIMGLKAPIQIKEWQANSNIKCFNTNTEINKIKICSLMPSNKCTCKRQGCPQDRTLIICNNNISNNTFNSNNSSKCSRDSILVQQLFSKHSLLIKVYKYLNSNSSHRIKQIACTIWINSNN